MWRSSRIAFFGVLLIVVACSPGEEGRSDTIGEPTVVAVSDVSTAPTGTTAASQEGECIALAREDVVSGAVLPEDSCYQVAGSLSVDSGELLVNPGVRISFGDGAGLTINSGGRLHAQGTAAKPIAFTSLDAAGSWQGIQFNASASASNMLHYVSIENGGSRGWTGDPRSAAALYLTGNTVVDIQNSTISGSLGQAINVYEGVVMIFEGNTLVDNAAAAWVYADVAGAISGNTVVSGNTDNVVRVGFSNGDAVTTAQTWQAGVPFEVQERFVIRAPLTLEPGTHITVRTDVQIHVVDGGSLTAEGIADAPIVITSVEDLPGYWHGLQISTLAAANRFDYVTFENGGSSQWTGDPDSTAMVRLEGNSKAVFTNSTFRGSGHYGLAVTEGGDIAGFENNTFTANNRAMHVYPDRAGSIAASNTFSGNTDDRVWVANLNSDKVSTTQTWENVGSPFYVADRVWIEASLTIAAGTVLEFAQDASLELRAGDGGSLHAAGTIDNPVVFQGGEDLPGYWKGISIGTMSAGNLFEHVVIRNAGSSDWYGGGDASSAIYIIDGSVVLDNVAFESIGGFAIIVLRDGSVSCASVDLGEYGFRDFVDSPPTDYTVCPAF